MAPPGVAPERDRLGRARALRAAGRPEEAVADLRAAAEAEPERAEIHHELGNALKSLRRYAEAAASLRRAAGLAPQEAAVWLNLGVACLEMGGGAEALRCFRRAVALEPGRAEARNILGHALLTEGRCAEARRELEEALRLKPGYGAAHDNLGRVLKAEGRAAEAVRHHRAALEAGPRPETHSNLLYSLNFPEGLDERSVAGEHRRWGEAQAAGAGAEPPRRSPAGRIRVGYVSPDFVNHAVAYFIEPVLAAHDRSRFEVFCYSDAPWPDAVTRRILGRTEHWRDVAGWSDARVAEQVRADGIDLLVDLAGHTARNRLAVFATRPAPVQATWIGYPNTTGLAAIDWRLTEAVADPEGGSGWHAERLWRLPRNFSCYLPPAGLPAAEPSPGRRGPVFGCFNNLAKLTPSMIALWARVLRGAPGSRLLLRSRGLSDPEVAARVRGEFAAAGADPAAIEAEGEPLAMAEHLRRYQGVDIALDPSPYNGTTTTCEALVMGVPVVSLAGGAHRSRVGASLLTHAGAPEWIARTPDEYLSLALRLAAAGPRSAILRQELRQRFLSSPVCDAPRFTRSLEAAFEGMIDCGRER